MGKWENSSSTVILWNGGRLWGTSKMHCLEIAFLLTLTIRSATFAPNYLYFQRTSILFALTDPNLNLDPAAKQVTGECRKDLETLRANLLTRSVWAMKMLDASGQKMPGFLFGQNHWLGDREICDAVRRPISLLISSDHERNMHYGLLNETAPFEVIFSVIYMRHNSPWQVEMKFLPLERTISVGLCAPESCGVEDIGALMRAYVGSELFEENRIYELDPQIIHVKRLQWNVRLFKYNSVICLLCFVIFTVGMFALAAVLRRRVATGDYESAKGGNLSQQFRTTLSNLVRCYDVENNATKIFKTNNGKYVEIPVISGMRSVVAIIIISLHIGFYGYQTYTNKPFLLSFAKNNSTIFTHTIVDCFFTISGFLQVYKFLSNPQNKAAITEASCFGLLKEFGKRLFHRFLRLAPLYYTILLFDVALYEIINDISVYQMEIRDDLLLRRLWWRYVIFTQNFLAPQDLAANWTWSMACEMQFFLVGTLMLFVYARRPGICKFLFVSLLLASVAVHYYNGITQGYGFNHDDFVATVTGMYANPIVRCMPYMIGALAGWYLAEKFSSRLSAFVERIVGSMAFVLAAAMLSPLSNGRVASSAVAISMLLLTRLSLAVWYAWLIVAGATERRTWIASFLEVGGFQHIGRLSYAIYLINPLIIILATYMSNVGIHIDFSLMILLYWGVVLTTYFASIVFSLAFEIPYCNMSTRLLKRR